MAKAELDAIEHVREFDQFEPGWYKFLLAANAADMIIAESATGAKSKPWYGRKKHLRRNDPLLRYMHAARNADEHGIEPVVEVKPGFFQIGSPGEAVHIGRLVVERGVIKQLSLNPVSGRYPQVRHENAVCKLKPVFDSRYGDTFDPPTEHLGLPLEKADAVSVAKLWLAYLTDLVSEAEKLLD